MEESFNTDAGSFVGETEAIYLIIEPDSVEQAVRELVRVGLDNIRGWFDASTMGRFADDTHSFVETVQMDAGEAAGLIEAGGVRVLDVRRATEFGEGHLAGAINIAHTRLASRLDEVPRDVRVLINCRTGIRSSRSAAFLQREGFEVVNLKGGIVAYQDGAVRAE